MAAAELGWIKPTEFDWAEKRSLVEKLYPTCTMDEVRTACRFVASDKEFRTRFKRWGLHNKNNKEHEIAALVRKVRQRNAVNKSSRATIHGKTIDMREILRYAKRKKISLETLANRARSQTPPGVECRTPDPILEYHLHQSASLLPAHGVQQISHWYPSPIPIDPPGELQQMEYLLGLVQQYIFASFRGVIWHPPSRKVSTAQPSPATEDGGGYCLLELWDSTRQAIYFFQHGDYLNGRLRLNHASAMVRPILASEHQNSLSSVLEFLSAFNAEYLRPFELQTRKYIAAMSGIVLGDSHPIHQFWATMSQLSWKDCDLLRAPLLKLQIHLLESCQGRSHPGTIRLLQSLLGESMHSPEAHRRYVTQALVPHGHEAVDSFSRDLIQLEIAKSYLKERNPMGLVICQEILERGPLDATSATSHFIRKKCLIFKAWFHWHFGEHDVAIDLIRTLSESETRPTSKISMLQHLQQWYLQIGWVEKAATMNASMHRIICSFNTEAERV